MESPAVRVMFPAVPERVVPPPPPERTVVATSEWVAVMEMAPAWVWAAAELELMAPVRRMLSPAFKEICPPLPVEEVVLRLVARIELAAVKLNAPALPVVELVRSVVTMETRFAPDWRLSEWPLLEAVKLLTVIFCALPERTVTSEVLSELRSVDGVNTALLLVAEKSGPAETPEVVPV